MRVERLERVAPDEDIDAITALEADAFTNPWSRETLVWELQNSDVTRAYVLRDADEGQKPDKPILAFCLCWVIFDELHINTLAVSPAQRRQGFATVLLRHVMEDAAAAGATSATLEVRASNTPALQLYQRLGFAVAATRRGYYTKPEEDALILRRNGLSASP